jgi:hypothetical protein
VTQQIIIEFDDGTENDEIDSIQQVISGILGLTVGYNYTITRNLGTRHDDPAINAFLAEGNYENIDAWMRDSDFTQRDGMWFHAEGHPVDPEGCIEGAMEASGFFEHFRD